MREIIENIAFAYNSMGKYFPIDSDSFDNLVDLNVAGRANKEKMIQLSTLLPILAQWSVSLELKDSYAMILKVTKNIFPNCTLQIWYPDNETDKFLYTCNAAFHSGAVEAPLILPESLEEMKEMIIKVQKNTIKFDDLSSVKKGIPILPLLSSRHYRTPIIPLYFQQGVIESQDD